MDLHEVLVATLTNLSDKNSLSSWSVFPEDNGMITLKIRFNAGHDAANRVTNAHFRRKSARQVERDAQRSRQWRNSQEQSAQRSAPSNMPRTDPVVADIPRSAQAPGNSTRCMTRSMARMSQLADTPETMRVDRIDETPAASDVLISPASMLDPNAVLFEPDTLLNDDLNDSVSVCEIVCSPLVTPVPDPVSDSCHSGDDASTCSSDDEKPHGSVCVLGLCHYGDGDMYFKEYASPFYQCTICPDRRWICPECFDSGAHRQHAEHIIRRKPYKKTGY